MWDGPDVSHQTPTPLSTTLAQQELLARSALVVLCGVAVEVALLALVAVRAGQITAVAPFAVPLVVAEVVAALLLTLHRPRAAATLSIVCAAASTIVLAGWFDAQLAVSPSWLAAGGVLALIQVVCARIAELQVPWRRQSAQVVRAALDRWSWVPTTLALVVLGHSDSESSRGTS